MHNFKHNTKTVYIQRWFCLKLCARDDKSCAKAKCYKSCFVFCREVRKTCDSEEHADRELLRNITKTWTSLKNLRSYQNCTNTPIKLNFTKWAIYFCFIWQSKGRLVTRRQLQTPSQILNDIKYLVEIPQALITLGRCDLLKFVWK